ncbi:MAG TPA: peptidoglycan DD-metalloendopeptidase family protein [Myxococcota bacterium]|nr:peptidoglycan DD-metalloendopeptidase family protein [Myxococcota bacterium]
MRSARRRVSASACVIILMCLPGVSSALTTPESGCVAKPGDWDISLPFEEGELVRITAGYGEFGGSTLHKDCNRSDKTNDHHAIDMILPNRPNRGLGRPVLAVAGGTVVKEGWGTIGWAGYGQRIYIEHDYNADGHKYISLYAHLNSIYVSEGQHVDKGEAIGELGGSTEGELDPYANWEHLHFVIHRDSKFEGSSGTQGSYGGNGVVPEPIDGYEDLVPGKEMVSKNSGEVAHDCEIVIGSDMVILEEDGPCFSKFGSDAGWNEEASGHGGHCLWTATKDAGPVNYALWNLTFADGGEYDVSAYVPAIAGDSREAKYLIRHAGDESRLDRSQNSLADDWLDLGRYVFAQGGDQWVKLEDNTRESQRTIVFDAVKIEPASGCECDPADPPDSRSCGFCGVQIRLCDGCSWQAWQDCMNEGACEPDSVDAKPCDGGYQERSCQTDCSWGDWGECVPGAPDGGFGDGGDGEVKQADQGCACGKRAAGTVQSTLAGLLLLFGFALLRRRRHRRPRKVESHDSFSHEK